MPHGYLSDGEGDLSEDEKVRLDNVQRERGREGKRERGRVREREREREGGRKKRGRKERKIKNTCTY